MTIQSSRRRVLHGLLAAGTAALLPSFAIAAPGRTVRIGYQKSSTLITLLKAGSVLEKRLEPLGVKVTWHEFTSGLPLLEALNVGSVECTVMSGKLASHAITGSPPLNDIHGYPATRHPLPPSV